MPVHYTIDSNQNRIRTTCDGYVTFPEVAQHFQELRRDPQFHDGLDVLLDLSGCTSLPSAEQLRDVVGLIDTRKLPLRFGACAIVATDDALFGMTRIFEVYARDVFTETEIFRMAEEGERWLNSLREWKVLEERAR
jgi:hypothetical protein